MAVYVVDGGQTPAYNGRVARHRRATDTHLAVQPQDCDDERSTHQATHNYAGKTQLVLAQFLSPITGKLSQEDWSPRFISASSFLIARSYVTHLPPGWDLLLPLA